MFFSSSSTLKFSEAALNACWVYETRRFSYTQAPLCRSNGLTMSYPSKFIFRLRVGSQIRPLRAAANKQTNNRFNLLKNVCIRSYKASWGLIRPYKVTLWTHLGLSWAVFGAILRNLIQSWTILGSFWDRFWAILNNFETILGTSSNL